jgi:hypothetical protein
MLQDVGATFPAAAARTKRGRRATQPEQGERDEPHPKGRDLRRESLRREDSFLARVA